MPGQQFSVTARQKAFLKGCLALKIADSLQRQPLVFRTFVDQVDSEQLTLMVPSLHAVTDRKQQLPFSIIGVLQVQISAAPQKGILRPQLDLLHTAHNASVCLQHAKDPVSSLFRTASRSTREQPFKSYEEYLSAWMPLLEMEAAYGAGKDNTGVVIEDVPIKLKDLEPDSNSKPKYEGSFKLPAQFCDERCIELGGRSFDYMVDEEGTVTYPRGTAPDRRARFPKERKRNVNPKYDVIVDECAMSPEPHSLVPIIATKARQVVLIGDHKQLRPIITCQAAADMGLDQSLFERLYKTRSRIPKTFLSEQYRMHPKICEFPSEEFYNGKLVTKRSSKWMGEPLSVWPLTPYREEIPHILVNVKGTEETLTVSTDEGNERSKFNAQEIAKVTEIYMFLRRRCSHGISKIRVLTQYNAQRCEIEKKLKEKLGDDKKVKVTTVVSSQGDVELLKCDEMWNRLVKSPLCAGN
nr:hypothetical protein BaRGS_033911 [Batillaria attramentaria]